MGATRFHVARLRDDNSAHEARAAELGPPWRLIDLEKLDLRWVPSLPMSRELALLEERGCIVYR